jgi:hypothetical protein
MSQDEVLQIIQNHLAGVASLRSLARKWGISAAYLSDVLRKKRYPGKKILKHLGLVGHVRRVHTFEARRAEK